MSHRETDKHLAGDDERPIAAQFFREEATGSFWLVEDRESTGEAATAKPAEELPFLPERSPAGEREMKAYWRRLRNFFRSGERSGMAGREKEDELYPLLLTPYRGRDFRFAQYPLWASGIQTPEPSAGAPFLPVMDLIENGVRAFAPQEGAAKILKDNLPRLERIIRHKTAFADAAYEALPVLEESLRDLKTELNISGPEGETLDEDIKRLLGLLPKNGALISGGPHAPLHFLGAFLKTHRQKERKEFLAEMEGLIARLNEILAVERDKSPEAQSSGRLHDALDFAGDFLNFEELSAVLPSGGGDAMPEERLQRIQKILETLQSAGTELLGKPVAFLVDPAIDDPVWRQNFPENAFYPAKAERLCRQATALYDERMGVCARIFAAVRLAQLELDGNYRSELHGDFFAHFDWRSFNEREMAVSPPVFLICEESVLLDGELDDFSHLLASGRLLKFFVLKRTVGPERCGERSFEEATFKRDLSALAIAHRDVCVVQTAIVDPVFLLEGLQEGLAAFSPVLFYVFVPAAALHEHYLSAGAAVEGRFFPSLLYNSERGPRWGSRFNIGRNPQLKSDWPQHSVAIKKEDGRPDQWRLPFTLADFFAQDASFGACFLPVPPEYWQENLVSLAEYLQMAPAPAFDKVPYIWLVDKQRQLHKAAVAWPLALSCREKLDQWRYLQENAGVHSYHVELATEKLRREIEERFEREITALKELHRKEVEKAAEEAARLAMDRLAARLLEMDPDVDLTVAPASLPKTAPAAPVEEKNATGQKSPATEAEKPKTAAREKVKEEEETLPPGEVWIDTPLCTSCNECIELNKNIFQYNEQKQAFVANPRGGPFADIVKAAETCPVRIIHPGAPQNPEEPGLDELIKRAEPYN